jgi:hypothetical protein
LQPAGEQGTSWCIERLPGGWKPELGSTSLYPKGAVVSRLSCTCTCSANAPSCFVHVPRKALSLHLYPLHLDGIPWANRHAHGMKVVQMAMRLPSTSLTWPMRDVFAHAACSVRSRNGCQAGLGGPLCLVGPFCLVGPLCVVDHCLFDGPPAPWVAAAVARSQARGHGVAGSRGPA